MTTQVQGLNVLPTVAALEEAILLCRLTGTTIIIIGPPGCGKTEITTNLIERRGREVLPAAMEAQRDQLDPDWQPRTSVIYGSHWTGDDWKGMPFIDPENRDRVAWSVPEQLYRLREGDALLIDEYTNPFDRTSENIFQSVAAGPRPVCGDWVGPYNLSRIFIGNPPEAANVTYAASPVLHQRAAVYEFNGPPPEEWIPWFLRNNGHPMIAATIHLQPDLLYQYDPAQVVSATPRSWTRASENVKGDEHLKGENNITDESRLMHMAACVGKPCALAAQAVFEMRERLVPFGDIVADPANAPIPDGNRDPAAMFLTVTMLSKHTTPDTWRRVCQYITRLPAEMQSLAMMSVVNRHKELLTTEEFLSFTVRTRELVTA
jgi:hypothetical protein